MAFADAVLGEDDAPLAAARDALRTAMGEPALVDSAAVAALFNAIDRVADATGTQVEDEKAALTVELRARMGIDAYARGKEG
jgi:hypothetical protein